MADTDPGFAQGSMTPLSSSSSPPSSLLEEEDSTSPNHCDGSPNAPPLAGSDDTPSSGLSPGGIAAEIDGVLLLVSDGGEHQRGQPDTTASQPGPDLEVDHIPAVTAAVEGVPNVCPKDLGGSGISVSVLPVGPDLTSDAGPDPESSSPAPGPTSTNASSVLDPLVSATGSDTNPASLDKGKQKQKVVHFQLPPETIATTTTTTLSSVAADSSSAVEGQSSSQLPATPAPPQQQQQKSSVFQPLQPGDPGWDMSADRPPAKQPIRFRDAVGRGFVFPWEKVKTWEGIERLICSSFAHVDVLGPHVNAGHYDLMVDSSTIAPQLATPLPTFFPAPPPETGTNSTVSGASPPTIPPPVPSPPTDNNNNNNPSPSSSPPSSTSTITATPDGSDSTITTTPVMISSSPQHVVILPELWDDLIVPGASVTMAMWPLESLTNQFPPFPPAVHHGFRGRGHAPRGGASRGGGGGRGRGRGGAPPPPPPPHVIHMGLPPPHEHPIFPHFHSSRVVRPRGKTRIRPRGDGGM